MSFKILNKIDSSVNAQGIKVGYKEWLDFGSKEFSETPDEVKATAYQACIASGWTDEGIMKGLEEECVGFKEEVMQKKAIEILKKLSIQYPCEVENSGKKTPVTLRVGETDVKIGELNS